MQALYLENNQLHYQVQFPLPQPQEGEALVRVLVAGICATDLALIGGYYPFTGILGHEFVGEIVRAEQAPARIGERVVGEINIACGQCTACLKGRKTHCLERTVLGIKGRHGAFADYLCLPLENLYPVPASIPNEAAVFTEPLAAALEIQQQISIRPTDQILVIGAGKLGQLIAQSLMITSAHLQVVARHKKQQQLLAARQIAWLTETAVTPKNYDYVIEATGSPDGFALARQAVRPQGTIVLKSTYKGERLINLSSLVVDEITLIGSRCGPFAPALRLLEQQAVDPTILIEERLPLEQGIMALKRAGERGVLKILLYPTNAL
jgi:threonine dehydrogenase-like Zn-dependent dehydrogenase